MNSVLSGPAPYKQDSYDPQAMETWIMRLARRLHFLLQGLKQPFMTSADRDLVVSEVERTQSELDFCCKARDSHNHFVKMQKLEAKEDEPEWETVYSSANDTNMVDYINVTLTNIEGMFYGQDDIGMLGSGASKGDGPNPKVGFIPAEEWKAMTPEQKKAHRLSAKQEKKEWIQKKGDTRGNKKAKLVGASLAEANVQVLASLDAAKEIEKSASELLADVINAHPDSPVVKAASSSPDAPSPPLPPNGGKKDPPKKFHLADSSFTDIASNFYFEIRERSPYGRGWILTVVLFFLSYWISPIYRWLNISPLIGVGFWAYTWSYVVRLLVGRLLASLVFRYVPAWLFSNYSVVETHRAIAKGKSHTEDLRADTISLGELKHVEPMLITVECWTCTPVYWWFWHWKRTEYVASMELLTQIKTAAQANLTCDNKTVFTKLYHAAKSTHSVNINRYRTLMFEDAVEGTAILAYAMHRRTLQQFENLNFPRPQPSKP